LNRNYTLIFQGPESARGGQTRDAR